MDNNWQDVTLGEAVDVNPSRRLPRGEESVYVAMDDLKIWQRHVNHWTRRKFSGSGSRFQNGDTLLARITPCLENGKTAFVSFLKNGEISHGSTEFIVLAGKQGVSDNLFVYYLTRSELFRDFAIQRMEGSSGRQRVPSSAVADFEFQLPPIDEQHRIAAVLGTLDDKIELNRRMNETLEAMAQTLFKSWFVDATVNGLPKGWRYTVISELCDINSWTLGKDDEIDDIEYIEISEVMRGNISNVQSFPRGKEPSRARRVLRHGDTVLSTVRPERGSYFLCLYPSPKIIASTGFAVLTPNKAPWSFIHAAVTQPDIFEFLGQQADGGAYPAVRPEIIGKLELPWPDDAKIIEGFHQVCAPLYEKANNNRCESQTLAAMRDTLLPKLLSGELRVQQAKQDIENIVSLPTQSVAKIQRKVPEEFVEAIMIAQLTRLLATPQFPLGRKRYNKFAYLAHRKAEDDVTQFYLKKAAGPYSPWAKYQGPEAIACKKGYVTNSKVGDFTGFLPGDKITEIDRYAPNYPICAAIDWVVAKFKFKKNDELELLATVDFAAIDLMENKKPVSLETVRNLIATNKEWAAKLKREIFSEANIARALTELRSIFPKTYAEASA